LNRALALDPENKIALDLLDTIIGHNLSR